MSAKNSRKGGSRKLCSEAVMKVFIERIEKVNPVINAICTFNDMILEEARAIDERLASGGARPLEGVLFNKGYLQTKGIRTTFGSLLLENDVPDEDTISVERLKAAGYIGQKQIP